MFDVFVYSARAIIPLLLIMALGYLFGRVGRWKQDFYRELNTLGFKIFLPVQLFCSIYATEDILHINWRLVVFLLVCVFLGAGLGYVVTGLFRVPDYQRGVMIQAMFRSNQAIVGYPICQALGGDLGFAAVVTATGISFYNALAVLALNHFAGKTAEKKSAAAKAKEIIGNPLIIGCLAGLGALLLRAVQQSVFGHVVFSLERDLPTLYSAAAQLANIASPLMLFILGARMDFSGIKELLPMLSLGITMRLIVTPAVSIGLAVLLKNILHLSPLEVPTLIAACASPVAVVSAVMVQEIGGDEQLANQLVVWSSALSVVTMFGFVFVLRSAGLL